MEILSDLISGMITKNCSSKVKESFYDSIMLKTSDFPKGKVLYFSPKCLVKLKISENSSKTKIPFYP